MSAILKIHFQKKKKTKQNKKQKLKTNKKKNQLHFQKKII